MQISSASLPSWMRSWTLSISIVKRPGRDLLVGQDSDQLAVLSERLEAMEQDNARLRAALASRKRGASEDEVRYQGTRVAWCTLFLHANS